MTKKVWALFDRAVSALLPTRIQTFTYYIPAPPTRKSGYREKTFDQITSTFINQGYKLISLNVVPHNTLKGGFWAIFTLKSTSLKTREIDLRESLSEDLILPLTDLVAEDTNLNSNIIHE